MGKWDELVPVDLSPAANGRQSLVQRGCQLLVAKIINRFGGKASSEGLESRESVLARTQLASVITDDNMAAEWRKVLRLQDPP